jgi:RNA polymerase primary sigma factor
MYLDAIGQLHLLTADEEKQLGILAQRGDEEARDRLIKANLRLVVKIAFGYGYTGLPILDLISEGNLGLINAVERYDPSMGNRLSTYAGWWIRQSIHLAVTHQWRTIRIPRNMVGTIARVCDFIRRYQEEFGREPENEAIADELQTSVKKIAHFKTIGLRPTSLNEPLNGNSDAGVLGDIVCDNDALLPDELHRDKSLSEDLNAAMRSLEPREALILALRFGLNGEPPMPLRELGRRFGVTRERIRQLERIALRKIRHRLRDGDRERTWGEFTETQDTVKRAKAVRELIARHSARSPSA